MAEILKGVLEFLRRFLLGHRRTRRQLTPNLCAE
jgi:hypothetical protein